MTLNTDFYVTTPGIDPDLLWNALLDMVEPKDIRPTRDEYTTEDDAPIYGPKGSVRRNTMVGIGLAAWCFMYYNTDGSEIARDEHDTDDPEAVDWDEDIFYVPRSYIRIDFDTAYGYRGPGDEGCSDLHGRIVTYLAGIVTAHGGEYTWKDEFTGEWFTDLTHVPDFGKF